MRNLLRGDASCRINVSLEGVDLIKKLLPASTVLHTFLKLRVRLSCNYEARLAGKKTIFLKRGSHLATHEHKREIEL